MQRAVKVVGDSGQAVTVEWLAGQEIRRATVPRGSIVDGAVDEDTLELGIPYGLPWEELCVLRVTPERIAANLRRRGIWTAADLRKDPNGALTAIRDAYGVDLAALRIAAEQYDKERQL